MKKVILGVLCFFPIIFLAISAIGVSKRFNDNCRRHLEVVASTEDIEVAKRELQIALVYLDKNNVTNYFVKAAGDDVSAWYKHLKALHEELGKLSSDISQEKKAAVLNQLRIRLKDFSVVDQDNVRGVAVPFGAAYYPNIGWWVFFFLFSFVLMIIGIGYLLPASELPYTL